MCSSPCTVVADVARFVIVLRSRSAISRTSCTHALATSRTHLRQANFVGGGTVELLQEFAGARTIRTSPFEHGIVEQHGRIIRFQLRRTCICASCIVHIIELCQNDCAVTVGALVHMHAVPASVVNSAGLFGCRLIADDMKWNALAGCCSA